MSDTPRTDKAAFPPPEALVTADFARELERELARVTAEVAALKACDPLAEMWRELASIVYAAMRFAREDVTPEWQAGNSHAEYRARQAATEIAEMLRNALAAENAALKVHDPLAEMWRELAEYQPIADLDGHGESWAKMCRERTEDAARAAMEDDAARSAAGYAAAAASGASGASMWARLSIALIRRAKEER